ncbi:embigin [Latimeria chalumnae]|uniref:embigin n=1 Tax=Latimeria chalumnae TaxID=7897 RepID=UPI0003C12B5E|nr:PREDICTED: embigin [Latimeria chalumnae]|eukprot:XP_005996990.1 PREDICTED: embigin [Latimeria chalumnae]
MFSTNITWKKDGEAISNSKPVTGKRDGYSLAIYKFDFSTSDHFGNYTCVFNIDPEKEATFIIRVPKVNDRDKPIINYEGDSTVLACKSHDATTWNWYKANGSEKVIINSTSDHYKITFSPDNTTLSITDLNENDSGVYFCSAIYEVGFSEGKVELKVLNIIVPLKVLIAIVAEVIFLVAVILIWEWQTKTTVQLSEDENNIEQSEKLKSEESNDKECTSMRQRKV